MDVSDFLNDTIEEHDGNGIAFFSVSRNLDFWWYFTALTLVLPQSVAVTVHGDVVRCGDTEAATP